MTEHSEPPMDHEGGGSLFSESKSFTRETLIQQAYKKAVLYQEILDDFTGTAKELGAKGDELAAKLNETCDHIGQDIVINGPVTRAGIDLRNLSSGKAGVKPEKDWDAHNTPARSLGYAAVKSSNPETKKPEARIYHVAKTNPLETITNKEYGSVYQEFKIYMDPRHSGNAELVDEVYPPNIEWLRDDEYGLGDTFVKTVDMAIEKGETLQEKLRNVSKIDFGSNERLNHKAYEDLKKELEYYISEKIGIVRDTPHFISGVRNVYFVRDEIPYDVDLAKGRHLNLIKRFSFVPRTSIPAIESTTIQTDGVDYDFYYPLSGKLHIANIETPGFTDNTQSN